jgi:predicted nuclease with TOPRIM domain
MATDRHPEAERRIRTAIDQLLTGQVPEGSKCDVKSLCALAGVPRATFYRTYPHLRAEFEQRLGRLRNDGEQPDHRLAQLERLKAEVVGLRERLSRTDQAIADLETFRSTALSRLAAQHDEITTLRRRLAAAEGPRLRALQPK